MSNINIASMMICGPPKYFGGKPVLSAYDGVWEPIPALTDELKVFLTDEVGNIPVYADALQLTDSKLLDILEKLNLFACFRGVSERRLALLDVQPSLTVYASVLRNLTFMGWDVCSGNGWLSASCHGCFPINPFDGTSIDNSIDLVNEVGLFNNLEDCRRYCSINDHELVEHAPWYPVAVYIPKRAQVRLRLPLSPNM